MRCEEARRWMELARDVPSRDGDSMDGVRRLLDEHLAQCANCRHYREWLQQTDELIGRAVRNVAVPPELKGRLLSRLAERPAVLSLGTTILRRRLVWFAAAAAVIVAVLGLYWLGRPSGVPVVELSEEALLRSLEGLRPAWDQLPRGATSEQTWADWSNRVLGTELPWPWAGRSVQLVRTGRCTVQGSVAYVTEWRFSDTAHWLVVLPATRYSVPVAFDGRPRVLKDSQSLSVVVWRNKLACYAVVYRGPLYEIEPVLPRRAPTRRVVTGPVKFAGRRTA